MPGRSLPLPFARPQRGWLGVRTFAILLVLVAPFAVLPFAGKAAAEGEGAPIAFGDSHLLDPIERTLGAASWMAASGKDPRLCYIPAGGAGRTEVDCGSYGVVT